MHLSRQGSQYPCAESIGKKCSLWFLEFIIIYILYIIVRVQSYELLNILRSNNKTSGTKVAELPAPKVRVQVTIGGISVFHQAKKIVGAPQCCFSRGYAREGVFASESSSSRQAGSPEAP